MVVLMIIPRHCRGQVGSSLQHRENIIHFEDIQTTIARGLLS
jgi:hypothetical protein